MPSSLVVRNEKRVGRPEGRDKRDVSQRQLARLFSSVQFKSSRAVDASQGVKHRSFVSHRFPTAPLPAASLCYRSVSGGIRLKPWCIAYVRECATTRAIVRIECVVSVILDRLIHTRTRDRSAPTPEMRFVAS
ncbi:hypothetical protein ALC53_01514 [Atta colombica]|uniref:Uncharacterized protein n=1 Tax=Atta colombica TaxID=520822 RepID=A0A195BTL6_9HYME|nr:hypothetical protein ALC53_01514 [Atta colombica]